jgi:nucleoside-diphosphate-sugar epimerase
LELSDKRILVTGANGFIASHLAARLATDEHAQVRGSIRKGSGQPAIERSHRPIEYVQADVTDRQAVFRAAAGCDIIVHAAACQPFAPQPPKARFTAVNVAGTENLLRAFAGGQGRFLLLSTINVHGIPPPINASADSPLVYSGDPYSDSKVDAECAAWKLAREHNIPLTIVRPGCTFGPRGYAWTLQPVERIRRGGPVLIGRGRGICNSMFVENLIDLIIAALKSEAAVNQCFIGCQAPGIEWRDFWGAYGRMLGLKPRSVPLWAAMVSAQIFSLYEHVTGRSGPFDRTNVAFYSHRVSFDVEKNVLLLDYRPRIPFQEGMRRTEEWLREQELI